MDFCIYKPFINNKKYVISPLTKNISRYNLRYMTITSIEDEIRKLNIPALPIYEDNQIIKEEAQEKKETKIFKSHKLAAITFDGSPTVNTEDLLKVLKKHNAKATFFISGSKINEYADTVKKIYNDGHQIANSGYSYTSFTTMDASLVRQEVYYTNKLLNDLGITNAKLVRPPFGYLKESIKNFVEAPFILWNIDSNDNINPNKEFIKNKIKTEIIDGSIILMHDNNINTLLALDELLPELINEGYEFVTINKMCEYNNVVLEKGKVYVRINKN